MTVEQAVNNILHAVYGEEVRESIAEALRVMNNKGEQDKQDAEAWAVGKRGGVAVSSTDETYHNNSKYYAERSNSYASTATSAASVATTVKNEAVAAKTDAQAAQAAAEAAQAAAELVGEQVQNSANIIQNTVDIVAAKESIWDSKANGTHDHPGYAKMLTFANKQATTSAWAASSVYSGFSFQATITCSGVTANHVPDVVFGPVEATSGNYAPVAQSAANSITIYARSKPSATITIPMIKCEMVVS